MHKAITTFERSYIEHLCITITALIFPQTSEGVLFLVLYVKYYVGLKLVLNVIEGLNTGRASSAGHGF